MVKHERAKAIDVLMTDEDTDEILAQCARCGTMVTLSYIGPEGQSTWDNWHGECPKCESEINYECLGAMTCEFSPKELREKEEKGS